jgi:hypothetical protein
MAQTLAITPDYFIVRDASGNVKFDSRWRYMRAGASGATFPFVRGETMSISANYSKRAAIPRYSVNGYVRQQTLAFGYNNTDSYVDPGTFNALFTLAKVE